MWFSISKGNAASMDGPKSSQAVLTKDTLGSPRASGWWEMRGSRPRAWWPLSCLPGKCDMVEFLRMDIPEEDRE